MDWKIRETLNSRLHLWAMVSLSARCVGAVRYGGDKGGGGGRRCSRGEAPALGEKAA